MAKRAAVTATDNASAMIAEAAYFKSEQRGFVAGHELADWLAAESEIAAILSAAGRRASRRAATPSSAKNAAKSAPQAKSARKKPIRKKREKAETT